MIDIQAIIRPADAWGDFVAAGEAFIRNIIGGIIEFGMVVALFPLIIGLIAYFTSYNKGGLHWLVNAIILEIILCCLYMAILGTNGPPDISIFFRPPS